MPASVKLDLELQNRLNALANTKQRSAHWMMREAIRDYVEREEGRLALNDATLAAWTEYQETGRHADTSAVNHWLSGWGTVEEADAPPCRD